MTVSHTHSRTKLAKDIGDRRRVTIEADTARVTLPYRKTWPMQWLQPDSGRDSRSSHLTHRKEHVNALEAKQQQTRERRIEKVITALRQKA